MKTLEIVEINGNKIVIKGIAKLYFEQGIPISITMAKCFENRISVSPYKLADEFIKAGISNERTESILSEAIHEIVEIPHEHRLNMINKIRTFLVSDYETQREFIYNSLFNSTDTAKDYLRNQLKQITQ